MGIDLCRKRVTSRLYFSLFEFVMDLKLAVLIEMR